MFPLLSLYRDSQSPDQKDNDPARRLETIHQLPSYYNSANWIVLHSHIGATSRPKSLFGVTVDILNLQYSMYNICFNLNDLQNWFEWLTELRKDIGWWHSPNLCAAG